MNRHGEKERLTSVPILCRITLQDEPYKDYKLLVLMSLEVATVIPKSPPAVMMATFWLLKEVGANMQLFIRRILEAVNSTEDGTN